MENQNDEQLQLRLSERELAQLKQLAKQSKCTMSELIRNRLEQSMPSPPRQLDNKELVDEINAVGRKIDAVAAQGNTLGWIDRDAYKHYVAEFYKLLERVELEFYGNENPAGNHSLVGT